MFSFVCRIGIAEKGALSLELRVDSSVGHASMPPRESSIGILCNAIARYTTTLLLSTYGVRGRHCLKFPPEGNPVDFPKISVIFNLGLNVIQCLVHSAVDQKLIYYQEFLLWYVLIYFHIHVYCCLCIHACFHSRCHFRWELSCPICGCLNPLLGGKCWILPDTNTNPLFAGE